MDWKRLRLSDMPAAVRFPSVVELSLEPKMVPLRKSSSSKKTSSPAAAGCSPAPIFSTDRLRRRFRSPGERHMQFWTCVAA